MPWMNVELSGLLNVKWKIFFRKGNRNSCSKWWRTSFAVRETTKQFFLRPYRESAMSKLLAKDPWCSGGRDGTMDWRQTFIVQSSTTKLPPVTGQCQCKTKCLLSRIVKEFSLLTRSVAARKKAQRYIDRERVSCSSWTARRSLQRKKGEIVLHKKGMEEG